MDLQICHKFANTLFQFFVFKTVKYKFLAGPPSVQLATDKTMIPGNQYGRNSEMYINLIDFSPLSCNL